MKFRSPETEELLSVSDMMDNWCGEVCKGKKCPINDLASKSEMSGRECAEWISNHPHVAARLMGCEVVEDENKAYKATNEYRLNVWFKATDIISGVPFRDSVQLKNDVQLALQKCLGTDVLITDGWMGLSGPVYQSPNLDNKDNAVEGMCCDCAHDGPCCSWDENEDCKHRKEDGTCWVPYTKEEANMDKPLKDWTLGECMGECSKLTYRGLTCEQCPLDKICGSAVDEWDLTDKPRWTEQEVERAKNLLEVVGPAELRKVADMVTMKVDGKIIYLRKDAFPSLKNEMAVTLDEIIGGAQ